MVHAPGRAVAARVPGPAPPGQQHRRSHPHARPGHPDHPAAGAALRGRRRHPLLRHRYPRRRDRLRRRRRARRRAGRGRSVPLGRRPRPHPPARPRGRHAVRARDRAQPRARAGRRAADRFRRRALHRRQLPGRRPAVAHVHPYEGAHARRAHGVAPPARPPCRPGHRLVALAGAGRGIGHPAVRLVGRRPVAGRLRAFRAAPQHQGVRRRRRPRHPPHPLRGRHG